MGLITTSSFEGDHVPGQLIIKLKENVDQNLTSNFILSSGAVKTKSFDIIKTDLFTFPSDVDLEKIAFNIQDHPDVEFVELNHYHYLQNTPNDKGFDKTYGLHNRGQTGGSHDADIDALEAWTITTGSRNVRIGVIDTGVDYLHPDLTQNYWVNVGEHGTDSKGRNKRTNGIDDDNNGFVDDYKGWDFYSNDNDPMDKHGHGTHCAGIIGARGNNKKGISGVNWKVSIVGLQIFNSKGKTRTDAIVSAINYASMLGLKITNNSWGSYTKSEAIESAITNATKKGMLFVAAAGNYNGNNDLKPFYPASYKVKNIISVGASDHKDYKASFSNYGTDSVDIAAPGNRIYSTNSTNKGLYVNKNGTSMAAPYVAGVAGLLQAKYPGMSASRMRRRILNYSDHPTSLSGVTSGARRLNAYKALTSSK